MKYFVLISAVILSVSCIKEDSVETLSLPGSAPPNYSKALTKWGTASRNDIPLKLSQDFIDGFVPADLDGDGNNLIDQMAKEWDSATSSINFFTLPLTAVTNKNYNTLDEFRDSEFGIYKAYIWYNEVSSNALAITQYYGIRKNGGTAAEYIEITHADIIVNYEDFYFSNDQFSYTEYDLPSVILHEMGHLLGLPHQINPNIDSVMQPYMSMFGSMRALYSTDRTDLQANYAVAALTAAPSSSVILSTISSGPRPDEEVRGIIELRADGSCSHYLLPYK